MNASEKRKQEKEEQKNARLNHILACTYELFSHGIETVTMNQIAQNAEIGVASFTDIFPLKNFLQLNAPLTLGILKKRNSKVHLITRNIKN